MKSALRLRRFQPGDEPALLAVFRSSVHGLAARDYSAAQRDAWAPAGLDDAALATWQARVRANRPFVVEADGQAVGFADVQPDGLIDQFFVAASHAGTGVGRMLMEALLAHAAATGLKNLSSHVSLTAQPFFLRSGFAVLARQTVTVRGQTLENALMGKTLAEREDGMSTRSGSVGEAAKAGAAPEADSSDARDAQALLARLDGLATHYRVRAGEEASALAVDWRRFGSGPPLVLLHGGHGNWTHWAKNIEALAARFTLWIPDMPGFGGSDTVPGDPHDDARLDRLVAALAGTLDVLIDTDTPIRLAGFSFGGLVAARLAAYLAGRPAANPVNSPARVGRLALLGPAGHGGARRQMMEMRNWRVEDRGAMLDALRHNLQSLMLHDARAIDALAMAIHEPACRDTRFRSKPLGRQPLLGPALDVYGGPALLLWGEHDVTAEPAEAGPRMAGGHAGRAWVAVPSGGHWVQFERAPEVNALLLDWFAQEGQGRQRRQEPEAAARTVRAG